MSKSDCWEVEEKINEMIRTWEGTVFGESLKNMYENGTSYECICEYAGIDYDEFDIE